MSGYAVFAYDVTDPDEYAKYNPGSMEIIMTTLTRHGGEVVTAGTESEWLQGARKAFVVLKFPSTDAAKAWMNDPDYAPAKAIREGCTTNRIELIAPEFVMPG